MEVVETHIVPHGTDRIRISDYLIGIFSLLPTRSSVRRALKRSEVLIDGRVANSADWIIPDQQIELQVPTPKDLKDFKLPIEILFEDAYMAVVYKPPGLEVRSKGLKNLENALRAILAPSLEADALHLARAVHRLDYGTQGLVLVAKTRKSHQKLSLMFEMREVAKTYLAIVEGNIPDSGSLDSPIEGRVALSHYECQSRVHSLKKKTLSLVKLIPHTGRRHQLRIHLAKAGYPIVGDQLYASDRSASDRSASDHGAPDEAPRPLKGKGLFLAATGLTLKHPILGEDLKFTAPIPHKFESLMAREEKRWKRHNPA